MTENASTIGSYLGLIRNALLANERHVRSLLPVEGFRMWALVIAGTETEGDVAALTRGGFAYVDIDRMMVATGANIVTDWKEQPDRLGILGTMLDAKIINIDMLTILSIARTSGNAALARQMKNRNMSVSKDRDAADRLAASELGVLMRGDTSARESGVRSRAVTPRQPFRVLLILPGRTTVS